MTKLCRRCGQLKPITEFNVQNRRGVEGRQSNCRMCQHERWAQRKQQKDARTA